MPEKAPGDHLRMAGELSRPGDGQSPSAVEVFIYALSNNLREDWPRRDQESEDKWVVQMLKSWAFGDSTTLQQLAISEQPTARALVEKLFGSAVRMRDTPIIEAMLDIGVDANHPVESQHSLKSLCSIKEPVGYLSIGDGGSMTPLQHAIHCGDISLARLLLNRGADVNRTVQLDDWAPLALSISMSRSTGIAGVELVRTLLSKGAAVNDTRPLVKSPLEIAAVIGNPELVEILLEAGASLDTEYFHYLLAHVRSAEVAWILLSALSHRKPTSLYLEKLLIPAIRSGNDVLVSFLLESVTDVNYEDEYGVSALSTAAEQKRLDICAALLRKGARPSRLPGEENWSRSPTALQHAAYAGDIKVVRLLLHHGARVDDYCPSTNWCLGSKTALQAAVSAANYNIAALLLDKGAPVVGAVFTMAIRTRHQPLISLFQPYFQPQEVDPYGASALETSLSVDNIPLAHWILDHTKFYHSGALCEAARIAANTSDISFLERLLSYRTHTHCGDDLEGTALGIAIWYRNQTLAQLLLDNGLMPKSCLTDHPNFPSLFDWWGMWRRWRILYHSGAPYKATPLQVAVEANDATWVGLLLQKGYHPDRQAVLSAATRGSRDMLKVLLDAGADVNDRDPGDSTPLQAAVMNRHTGVVQFLLRAGADVNAYPQPCGGRTALVAAIEKDDIELVGILLKENADVNGPAAIWGGATALQMAAIRGSIGLVRKLLELKADYDAPSLREGRTALEAAAEYGRIDILQLLLTAGVSTDGSARRQYVRAVKFAVREGHIAAAGLLKNFRQWTEEDLELFQRQHLCDYDLEDEEGSDEGTIEDMDGQTPGPGAAQLYRSNGGNSTTEDDIFQFIQWPEGEEEAE